MSEKNITHLTAESFNTILENSKEPILVDFWAAWCGPCRMVAPVLEEIADEYEGKLKVCKVNVDDEGLLSQQFGVMSIPTLIVFKDGKVVNKSVGAQGKEGLVKLFENYL